MELSQTKLFQTQDNPEFAIEWKRDGEKWKENWRKEGLDSVSKCNWIWSLSLIEISHVSFLKQWEERKWWGWRKWWWNRKLRKKDPLVPYMLVHLVVLFLSLSPPGPFFIPSYFPSSFLFPSCFPSSFLFPSYFSYSLLTHSLFHSPSRFFRVKKVY